MPTGERKQRRSKVGIPSIPRLAKEYGVSSVGTSSAVFNLGYRNDLVGTGLRDRMSHVAEDRFE
jgi:hypothetical protein